MRVVQIMNWHRFGGGSDFMAKVTGEVLRKSGHDVYMMTSDSASFDGTFLGRAKACARGIYSRDARREMREILKNFAPDLVHVHEVYPAHSPWVLRDCRDAGVPVVMTCHDFRVTCPVSTHISHGEPCDRCTRGSTLSCFTRNCRENRFESAAFALRAGVAKSFRLFEENVNLFLAPSHFIKQRMIDSGLPSDKLRVVPNMVRMTRTTTNPGAGTYAAFVGRVAPEKGLDTLMEAAWRAGMPLHIAGHGAHFPQSVAPNVHWRGHLSGAALTEFYAGARFVVVPSRWFEAFGLVVAEAMMLGIPVIAANAGALPELVDHGVTGFLFTAGDSQELARCMSILWKDGELCRRMGVSGRAKAMRMYTAQQYYVNLMMAYKSAAKVGERTESPESAKTRQPQVVQ
ncbi:MAG: glycosyltransferase [Candidatus Hydrogenedentes bacterium]|nr:glycosyltransferase [Candidatus Hydrogenedentota bacterium]